MFCPSLIAFRITSNPLLCKDPFQLLFRRSTSIPLRSHFNQRFHIIFCFEGIDIIGRSSITCEIIAYIHSPLLTGNRNTFLVAVFHVFGSKSTQGSLSTKEPYFGSSHQDSIGLFGNRTLGMQTVTVLVFYSNSCSLGNTFISTGNLISFGNNQITLFVFYITTFRFRVILNQSRIIISYQNRLHRSTHEYFSPAFIDCAQRILITAFGRNGNCFIRTLQHATGSCIHRFGNFCSRQIRSTHRYTDCKPQAERVCKLHPL